jgi:uncharacterized membrane protein/protein-disulfide isomerase
MSPSVRWLIVACALAGLALSIAAARVHYRLLTDVSYVSPCDISATFNCSAAYLSRYGSIGGVPVALGGVLWFGMVLLVAAFARPAAQNSAAATYLFVLVLVGVPVVAFLGYASYARLRTGCPICMGTYACVAAILVLTSRTDGVPLRELPGRLGEDLAALLRRGGVLLLTLLLFGGVLTAAVLFPREGSVGEEAAAAAPPPADVQADFAAAWDRAAQNRVDLGIPAEGAKVLIVKFNDYECTTCRIAETYYGPILDKFKTSNPGAVKVVFKDWVWNNACNSFVQGTIPGHEASCVAAVAARLARERGQYDAMKTWLFANQGLSPADVQAHAVQSLGVKDFAAEYARVMPKVQQDIADGGALQIAGTPTYFINGIRIPSERLMAPEYFEMAIALELRHAD